VLGRDGAAAASRRHHLPLAEASEYMGIGYVRLHDARHSCATLMHLRGTPIAVIAAWLGHASAAFTMATYAHSQDEALKAAASSFGRVVTFSDTETSSRDSR